MTTDRRRGGRQANISANEVLLEIQRHGNILRVTAIDPITGTEVLMMADPRQSMLTIKRLAARKLAYVLEKKRAEAAESNGKKPSGFNKLI